MYAEVGEMRYSCNMRFYFVGKIKSPLDDEKVVEAVQFSCATALSMNQEAKMFISSTKL